jgi:hypothetical protein
MSTHKVRRQGRVIPFGYRADLDDPDWLIPVPHELDALEKAIEYTKVSSLRQTAQWLTKKTGRYISHMGLKKIKLYRNQHLKLAQ